MKMLSKVLYSITILSTLFSLMKMLSKVLYSITILSTLFSLMKMLSKVLYSITILSTLFSLMKMLSKVLYSITILSTLFSLMKMLSKVLFSITILSTLFSLMKMLSKVLASDLGESDDDLASKAHYQIFCPASFLFSSSIQLYFFPILHKLVRHSSTHHERTGWRCSADAVEGGVNIPQRTTVSK